MMILSCFNATALLLEQHLVIYLSNLTKTLRQMTNNSGICEQTIVPGCAQTILTVRAKRQFGRLEQHLCHTLELGT